MDSFVKLGLAVLCFGAVVGCSEKKPEVKGGFGEVDQAGRRKTSMMIRKRKDK